MPRVAPLPSNAGSYAGWYQTDFPRNEMAHFIERLMGIVHVRYDGKRRATSLGGRDQVSVPVTGGQFRDVPKKGHPEPVPLAALLAPDAEGQFIEFAGGVATVRRIPASLAITELSSLHGSCAALDSWRSQQKAPPSR